jgi:hypothetical protein
MSLLITTEIIAAVSFIAAMAVVWSKSAELSTGKGMFQISTPERDTKVINAFGVAHYQITHVSRKSIIRISQRAIVAVENMFMSFFVLLGKKFSTIGDVVRGKDIPKNRGAVSFFLKNIETKKEVEKLS